jgi:hypothetical protein
MRNEQIDGLTINHSLAPLLEEERMRTLDVEEMESSSKVDLRDVSWLQMPENEGLTLRQKNIGNFLLLQDELYKVNF